MKFCLFSNYQSSIEPDFKIFKSKLKIKRPQGLMSKQNEALRPLQGVLVELLSHFSP